MHSQCTVADFILDIISQFGERPFIAFRFEHGIITKTRIAPFFSDYLALYHSFKKIFLSVQYQRNGSTELCFAIFFAFQFVKQFEHIGLGVVSFAACIAGGIDSGGPVQGFYFQSGIIGKAIQAVVFKDKRRFQQGISLQRLGCFGNIRMATDIVEAQQFYLVS